MASAGKRAGRETTEGLVGYIVDGGVGSIVGIGCETEPVSKNEAFQEFAIKVLRARPRRWSRRGDEPSRTSGSS